MKQMKRLVLSACVAVLALLAAPYAASARFHQPPGITLENWSLTRSANSITPDPLQAGAHPDITLHFTVSYPKFVRSGGRTWTDDLDHYELQTPPGLIGNVNNLPHCSNADYFQNACPLNTIVGESDILADQDTPTGGEGPQGHQFGYIYNVVPVHGEAARLAAINAQPFTHLYDQPNDPNAPNGEPINAPATLPAYLPGLFFVRTTGDYGLTNIAPETRTTWINTDSSQPQDTSTALQALTATSVNLTLFGAVRATGKPFVVNPTSCGTTTAELKVVSEGDTDDDTDISTLAGANADPEGPQAVDTATTTLQTTGCQSVPFDPSVEIAPTDTNKVGAPSGYRVGIKFPNSWSDPTKLHQSHLKDAVVKLPPGVGLNPAAALDLDGCTESQFGFGNDNPVRCPASSAIGDVQVTTPVLDTNLSTPNVIDPLKGKAYFAQPTSAGPPTEANPWHLYFLIEGGGLRVKLRGDTFLDQQTGQITTVFKDQPQTPFTDFELTLRGGNHAILQNPPDCGPHALTADFTGWSGKTKSSQSSVNISGDGAGAPCPSPKPFNPAVDASSATEQAGASTTSKLVITRQPGDQLINHLKVSLPAGLAGSLAAVPLCSSADARAGTCPGDSKVGSVTTTVGDGGDPISFTGSIYLAEPLAAGDAASLSVVIPAKVGPIDLGHVTVLNQIRLRDSDSGVDAFGDIPTIFGGIPLPVRRIEINVDKDHFLINPTGCDERPLIVSLSGDEGGTSNSSVAFHATGCGALPYEPKLRLIAGGKGGTAKGAHTQLTAIVTQNDGEANNKKSVVTLPSVLRPDTINLNKPGALCNSNQLALNACPPTSRIGTVKAQTPLLPFPLEGPAYIVLKTGSFLPNLVLYLQGHGLTVKLEAQNSIQGVRTVNTFGSLPDVPVTRFELTVNGGPSGILKNFSDLCSTPDHADATFTGFNGKVFSSKPDLEVEGCGTQVSEASISKGKIKVTRSGVAPVPVKCKGATTCEGSLALAAGRRSSRASASRKLGRRSFGIAAGKTKVVRVKLSRKAFKSVRRKHRLRATASLALKGAGTKRQSITLIAPKRRR